MCVRLMAHTLKDFLSDVFSQNRKTLTSEVFLCFHPAVLPDLLFRTIPLLYIRNTVASQAGPAWLGQRRARSAEPRPSAEAEAQQTSYMSVSRHLHEGWRDH